VDYERPETLDAARAGIDTLLLISSSEIGKRARQHRNVIAAAKQANIQLLAYTSVLHADTSVLGLAEEHRQRRGGADLVGGAARFGRGDRGGPGGDRRGCAGCLGAADR
jgi:NAD(P)H dehydrogenase (quinone)